MLYRYALRCPSCRFHFHLKDTQVKKILREEIAKKINRVKISQDTNFFKTIEETVKIIEQLVGD